MGHSYTIFIGTVGNGLQYSRDGGESWDNATTGQAPPNSTVAGLEGNVRALGVYPNDPHRILAGTDWTGIYRSDDNGESWNHLKSPMEGMEIWSIDVDPADSDKIYVGTRPQGFRSSDGGESWEKMDIGVDESAPLWPPRTTKITVDPRDSRTIWAGVEVDGVHKSLDGGDSWVRLPDVGPSQFYGDIHCMAINAQDSRVYATSPFGIATSLDEGESWDVHEFPGIREGEARSYCRAVIIKQDDPDTMFVGSGNGIPGEVGAIRRTRDGGATWDAVSLPVQPNSVVYWLGTHRDVPDTVAAASIFGYVYLSEDGGDSWGKAEREFGHIRTVAVTPN